ncbi:hypothetical protein E3O44_15810 [Cryobacterium algoricola]|uniref:Uncharacterized protein n=1 Tax=Cryobacterium algoricola TaxID=1259183 RepID=A0ABY2I8V3_9MICO|nr:hypothetical protein [Cryobacterium algoricola]TFB84297.1 hypothetical protein E3O44_15810 [Cryobacterium algoricola]
MSRISMSLPRPQYVAVPEAFISALAWKILHVDRLENSTDNSSEIPMVKDIAGKPIGLLFRTNGGTSRLIKMKQTLPTGIRLVEFVDALEKAGLQIEGGSDLLGEAVLNSLDGVRIEKSGGQPASPLTPSIALLQNMRGALGTKGPPDTAMIIESLFALGASTSPELLTASRLWLRAAKHRMEIDPLLNALDSAVDRTILGSQRVEPPPLPAGLPSAESVPEGDYSGTPFDWFASAWLRLTSDEWVEALPARVWVDWATTVLRLATGLGFLWECSWNEAFARAVLKSETVSWGDVRSEVRTVLPWGSSRAGTVALDVAPQLVARVYRSERLRSLIADRLDACSAAASDFGAVMDEMRDDEGFARSLTEALSSNERVGSGKNVWEAITYALKTRETSESRADYYGLLQSNGRYLKVDPGTEWIAVVASLSCVTPGASSDVGRVMADLEKMGMRPNLSDLVALLERAGMARGSADADQGVRVESAY